MEDNFLIQEDKLKKYYKTLKRTYNHFITLYYQDNNIRHNVKAIYSLMLMKLIYYSYHNNKEKIIEVYHKCISFYRTLKSINKYQLANEINKIAKLVKLYLKNKEKANKYYFN